MTGIEAISKIVKHVEERLNVNSTFYVDLGNPEYLNRTLEDAIILGYLKELAERRSDENENHD